MSSFLAVNNSLIIRWWRICQFQGQLRKDQIEEMRVCHLTTSDWSVAVSHLVEVHAILPEPTTLCNQDLCCSISDETFSGNNFDNDYDYDKYSDVDHPSMLAIEQHNDEFTPDNSHSPYNRISSRVCSLSPSLNWYHHRCRLWLLPKSQSLVWVCVHPQFPLPLGSQPKMWWQQALRSAQGDH